MRRHGVIPRKQASRVGVTLVEMSVVLVVIGLIILIVFPALTALRSATQQNLTASNLQALLRATAAYVQANGCVPCPTPATTTGAGFGLVRGASGAACGACDTPEGIPPFVSLGLPASMARDGWSRWITMRVDPALTEDFKIVPPSAGTGQTGLCKAGLSKTKTITVTAPSGPPQPVAVLFLSHGPNGYGAFVASAVAGPANGERLSFPASAPACTATGGPEHCNAAGTGQFRDAPQAKSGTKIFDDMMLYLDRNALVSLFGSGACATVW